MLFWLKVWECYLNRCKSYSDKRSVNVILIQGVELDQLQTKDKPHWTLWLPELCHRLSRWLLVCFWWQGKLESQVKSDRIM